jgi:hypothetical protein
MRLILIDKTSGLIFGDTANYLLARLDEWRESNSDNSGDAARLSLLAVRLLDDSIGGHGNEYGFFKDGPREVLSGYLIYRADINGSDVLPVVTDGKNENMIAAVQRDCRLEGFVECRRNRRR